MIRIGNKVVAGSADVDLSTVLKSLNKTGLSVWVGTQTEHDALPDTVKNDEKTTFITYDTDEDIYLIIDTIVSYGKTWSSVKISSELAKKINASDVYTKEQVDEIINAKLASALKYRGAVNTTALLPASAENGDTYFVKADGFIYAYNSTSSAWDALGTVADMTNYFTKTEITALLQDKADKFQYDVLPTASSETVGILVQYTGADTQDYKNGYFYKGIDNGNDTYTWELAKIGKYEDIINDSATSASTTWSSEKISADLANKQDFRLFKSLEEFNEKKGTSLTVVSGVDNMKDIANAMSDGEMLIIIIKYELSSDVYFGLTTSTGWTKMFAFIKSNGLCDVECRTTLPLTIKRVLNSDGVVGDWQELATTDSTIKASQLSGSVDCNMLTEPGLYTASAGAVSALTNAPVDNTVQLNGGFSVLVTKTNIEGVFYGTQMFIPYGSDVPFIRKAYYLNGQHWTDWQQLATMNNLPKQYTSGSQGEFFSRVMDELGLSGYPNRFAYEVFGSASNQCYSKGVVYRDNSSSSCTICGYSRNCTMASNDGGAIAVYDETMTTAISDATIVFTRI